MDRRLLLFVSTALAVGLLVGSAVTYAALQSSFSIPTSGSVLAVNVGVYSDSACTQNFADVKGVSLHENMPCIIAVFNC